MRTLSQIPPMVFMTSAIMCEKLSIKVRRIVSSYKCPTNTSAVRKLLYDGQHWLAVLLFGGVCATYASPAPFPFDERDWQEQQQFTELQDYPDGDGNMEVNTEQNNPMFQFDKERNQLVFISAAAEQASCTNLAVPTIIHGNLNIQICPERNNCGFVKVKLGRIVDTHVDICKPGLVQAIFFLFLMHILLYRVL